MNTRYSLADLKKLPLLQNLKLMEKVIERNKKYRILEDVTRSLF